MRGILGASISPGCEGASPGAFSTLAVGSLPGSIQRKPEPPLRSPPGPPGPSHGDSWGWMPCLLGSLQECSRGAITGARGVAGMERERECTCVKGSIGVWGGGRQAEFPGKRSTELVRMAPGLLSQLLD